jgi:hypothetical protein
MKKGTSVAYCREFLRSAGSSSLREARGIVTRTYPSHGTTMCVVRWFHGGQTHTLKTNLIDIRKLANEPNI